MNCFEVNFKLKMKDYILFQLGINFKYYRLYVFIYFFLFFITLIQIDIFKSLHIILKYNFKLVIILILSISVWVVLKSIKAYKTNVIYSENMMFILKEDRFIMYNKFCSFNIEWKDCTKIFIKRNYCYIFIGTLEAIIIPIYQFENAIEIKEFLKSRYKFINF